jgi:hypothetical protein
MNNRDAVELFTGIFYIAFAVVFIIMLVAQYQLFAIRKAVDNLVKMLRTETPDNPKNSPCPICKTPNALTAREKTMGMVCSVECAKLQQQ